MFKFLRIPVIVYAYFRMRLLSYRLRTRAGLERWQQRQLRRHMRFLYNHSPYFRALMPSKDARGWQMLPILGKAEMMQNFATINTRGVTREQALEVAVEAERTRDFNPTINGVTVGLSSGTSGHRGIFMASPLEQWMYAGTVLAKILPGFWRRRNRVAFFLRANNNLYTAVKSRALQFEYFDLLVPLEQHLPRLVAADPTLLIAPPSLLRQLAELQRDGRIVLRPQKIISVAEVLDPVDEEFIGNVFQQRVHQIYQATEGFLATTCRLGVLHLNEDLMHIEKEWLDRKVGKFQPIITDFSRKTQPIVRYRLNDILTVKPAACGCGSPLTALEFIEGRSDDLFHLQALSGTGWVTVYPDFIRRAMLFASDRIVDYRVLQIAADVLEVHFSCSVAEKFTDAISASRSESEEISVRNAVIREFQDLAHKLGARITRIDFVKLTTAHAPKDGKKLRRIVNLMGKTPADSPSVSASETTI